MILRFQDEAGVCLGEEQRGSFTLPRVGELVTVAGVTRRVSSVRWMFDDGPTRIDIVLAPPEKEVIP